MDSKKISLIGLIACVVIALPFVNRSVFGTTAKEVNVSTLSQRVISPSILASGFLAHEEEVMIRKHQSAQNTAQRERSGLI